jgi:diguanylate cyclase
VTNATRGVTDDKFKVSARQTDINFVQLASDRTDTPPGLRVRRGMFWLTLLATAITIVFALSTVLRENGSYIELLDAYAYNVPTLLAAGVCFLRATRRGDRLVWGLFGCGQLTIVLAEVSILAVYGNYDELPVPSIADALFISFYPFVITAVVSMLRRDAAGHVRSMLLDGAISGLAVGAYVLWLAVGPVLSGVEGTPIEVATYLAVPAFDFLLLVIAAVAFSILGRKAGRHWLLILASLVLQAGADTAYYVLSAYDLYVEGTLLDAAWPAASLCIALAAIVATTERGRLVERSWVHLAGPTFVGLVSLGLLVIDRTVGSIPAGSFVMVMIAVVLVGVRTIWSYRALQSLADTRRQARTDDLTGLHNRRHLHELLQARTAPGAWPFALLTIDLDRFKEVNDSLGHGAGDDLLRVVADRLTTTIGGRGEAIRVAGDEFSAVLPDGDAETAMAMAASIREALMAPIDLDGVVVHVDASIGIALWPNDGRSNEELLSAADHVMYRAKTTHAGVLRFDAAIDRPERDRLELAESLRGGIADGSVAPYYQAQVDLATGEVAGLEALVRWNHPTRGLIMPVEVIPLAERAGLLHDLTLAVLRRSLADLARWHAAGSPSLTVAVNVGAASLRRTDFPNEIAAALARAGTPASALVLEITEDTVMEQHTESSAVLATITAMGVRVSVDDYGTGQSSLAHLRDLPASELKLDRSFVAALDDPTTVAIVRSTISLADELGRRLVAEGIEDVPTAERLLALGCRWAQGYHFHRPEPVAAIDELLAGGAPVVLPGGPAWPAPTVLALA